jgi:hypothetical protein
MAGMGVWSQLPSVTTWFTHRDSKYKGLTLQMPGQRVLEPSLEDFEVRKSTRDTSRALEMRGAEHF